MEIDIQKNMKADGMAVSTYIENGTADMTQQLTLATMHRKHWERKVCRKIIR